MSRKNSHVLLYSLILDKVLGQVINEFFSYRRRYHMALFRLRNLKLYEWHFKVKCIQLGNWIFTNLQQPNVNVSFLGSVCVYFCLNHTGNISMIKSIYHVSPNNQSVCHAINFQIDHPSPNYQIDPHQTNQSILNQSKSYYLNNKSII